MKTTTSRACDQVKENPGSGGTGLPVLVDGVWVGNSPQQEDRQLLCFLQKRDFKIRRA